MEEDQWILRTDYAGSEMEIKLLGKDINNKGCTCYMQGPYSQRKKWPTTLLQKSYPGINGIDDMATL